MLAIKARFDGRKVILPKTVRRTTPGEVIVVFTPSAEAKEEAQAWLKAQERAFAKVWNNDEDAVYDTL